jgi:hypothetical protein
MAEIVERVSAEDAGALKAFYASFMHMALKQPAREPTLMKDDQLARLLEKLEQIDTKVLDKQFILSFGHYYRLNKFFKWFKSKQY